MSSAAVDVRDRVAARGLALDGAETFTSAGNGSGTFLDSSSSDSSDGRSSSSSCSTGGMLTRVTRGRLVPASCAGAAVYGAKLKIVMVGVSSILAGADEGESVVSRSRRSGLRGLGPPSVTFMMTLQPHVD